MSNFNITSDNHKKEIDRKKTSHTTPPSESFQATAYVPTLWQKTINIGRVVLFFIVIGMLAWFTIGSDLLYGFQKRSFEKSELTGFFKNNKTDFLQFYNFTLARSQKLSRLTFDKSDQKFEVRIEDQHMPKQPRPAMVLHVANNPWRKKDYERVVNNQLFVYRDEREKTLEKDWMYDFEITQGQEVQPDILSYLNTTQLEFSSVLSSLKAIGKNFEIYPDSIVATLDYQKFGKYHLLYYQKPISDDQWNKIDTDVYFKRVPKIWGDD